LEGKLSGKGASRRTIHRNRRSIFYLIAFARSPGEINRPQSLKKEQKLHSERKTKLFRIRGKKICFVGREFALSFIDTRRMLKGGKGEGSLLGRRWGHRKSYPRPNLPCSFVLKRLKDAQKEWQRRKNRGKEPQSGTIEGSRNLYPNLGKRFSGEDLPGAHKGQKRGNTCKEEIREWGPKIAPTF